MEKIAQPGQDSVPGRVLPSSHYAAAMLPRARERSQTTPSLSQGSATSFPQGNEFEDGKGQAANTVISPPQGLCTCGWRQMLTAGPGRMVGELPNLCGLLAASSSGYFGSELL